MVELTEHERVDDCDPLVHALDALRAIGVRLAVDDSGAGFAGLQYILRLRPDIIKLDRYLIVGAGEDPVRRSLTTALVEFSTSVGATVLAEGIESEAELVSLRELGVSLGQGYYLGMPAPLPGRAHGCPHQHADERLASTAVPGQRSGRASWSICMSSTGAPVTSTIATSTPGLGRLGSMRTRWSAMAAVRSSTSKATCGTDLIRSG